ncbi:MAG TPA: tRNA uridine-5-carboxymethylaminomethyl(34) synthesis GTPase MnmE, partial [Acidobacteriota bacterium]|nr:tRNA uridine-5-carboxymethylaminomethyl(34) synthesis GTPase MnmE [Acidobacteriota bacterium]
LEKFRNSIIYIIINKIDVSRSAWGKGLAGKAGAIPAVRVSALKGTNIDGLTACLHDTFTPSKRKQEDAVLHLRQKLLLEEMLAGLERSRTLHREGYPDEIVAEELRGVLPAVGRLTGEIKAGEVIDDIFGRFCVGK